MSKDRSGEQPDVVRLPIDKLHPNPWNPNRMPEHIRSALTKNIERAGFNQPVLVRPHPELEGEWEIVDGEHRWYTAKEAGEGDVQAIVREYDDAEAKLQTVAMNKLRGEMEPADVARLIREADEAGIPIAEQAEFTGYTEAEAEALQKLLDFDWNSFGNAPTGDDPKSQAGEEEWVDLRFRVPESIATMLRSELDRLKEIRETEHDHLALEVMVVNSSHVTPEAMTGEEF